MNKSKYYNNVIFYIYQDIYFYRKFVQTTSFVFKVKCSGILSNLYKFKIEEKLNKLNTYI